LVIESDYRSDWRHEKLFSFDPFKGAGAEITSLDLAVVGATQASDVIALEISPDGTQIALTRPDVGRIYVQSLKDGSSRSLQVKNWPSFGGLTWTADSRAFLIIADRLHYSYLLRVDMEGNAIPLWQRRGLIDLSVVPSPDGAHVAMLQATQSNNIWMMEDF
jgi:Tol biopolymer transport system component